MNNLRTGFPEIRSLLVDAESGVLIGANTPAQLFFGLEKDISGKKKIADIFFDGKKGILEKIFLNALQKTQYGVKDSICVVERNDIQEVEIQASSICLADKPAILISLQDLHKHTQGENVLLEREVFFRSYFEQSPDAVFLESEDDEILDANPAASKLLGYSHLEFLKMKVSDLIAPEAKPQFIPRSVIKNELSKPKVFESIDLHRDGRKIPVEVRNGRLLGIKGNLILSIVRDTTEKNRFLEDLERQVADRMGELSILYDIVNKTSDSTELKKILWNALLRILKFTRCSMGMIHICDNEGTLQRTADINCNEELILRFEKFYTFNFQRELKNWSSPSVMFLQSREKNIELSNLLASDIATYIGLPIRVKGEIIGWISIFRDSEPSLTQSEVSFLSGIAKQMGIAVEIESLRFQVETRAIINERQRLARDLHDSVMQSLYSLSLMCKGWRRLLQREETCDIETWLNMLDETIGQILLEMRLLLYEVFPFSFQEMGLVKAISQRLSFVEQRVGIETKFVVKRERKLSLATEESIYFIAQEALNNTLKHAKSHEVLMKLDFLKNKVILSVKDDGVGFNSQMVKSACGMGLSNMESRVKELKGELEISSVLGKGTTVKVTVNE